jgi:hypothetical protein
MAAPSAARRAADHQHDVRVVCQPGRAQAQHAGVTATVNYATVGAGQRDGIFARAEVGVEARPRARALRQVDG